MLDSFSRRIVGWSIADHMRTELFTYALGMAILRRYPTRGRGWLQTRHNSDRVRSGRRRGDLLVADAATYCLADPGDVPLGVDRPAHSTALPGRLCAATLTWTTLVEQAAGVTSNAGHLARPAAICHRPCTKEDPDGLGCGIDRKPAQSRVFVPLRWDATVNYQATRRHSPPCCIRTQATGGPRVAAWQFFLFYAYRPNLTVPGFDDA